MKITYTYDTDEIQNPDVLGELLRDLFFEQDGYAELGCYTCFETRPSAKYLGTVVMDEEFTCPLFRRDDIYMTYYWDGDGTLVFKMPDGRVLANTDCKKDHRWYWTDTTEFDF